MRWCALLLATVFLVAARAEAQPAEFDWRSAFILRFDPGAHHDDGYLKSIADGFESGWISESGAGAIVVGPLAALTQDAGVDVAVIDPSLGTVDDWERLLSGARGADIAVVVDLTLPGSSDDYGRIAAWAAASGIRHFIVDGVEGDDGSEFRVALNEALSGKSWIARKRTSGDDPFGAGDENADPTAGSALVEASGFDAVIETVPIGDLSDDASLGALYRTLGQRSASAPQPIVADMAIPPGSDHVTARVLMLPGALQLTAPSVPSEVSELWRGIAAFRARHPAISLGEHVDLVNNTFAFARTATESGLDDRVVVVLGASGKTTLNVSRIFQDNAMLVDALTGRTAFVSFGMATFEAGPSGVILVEEAY